MDELPKIELVREAEEEVKKPGSAGSARLNQWLALLVERGSNAAQLRPPLMERAAVSLHLG